MATKRTSRGGGKRRHGSAVEPIESGRSFRAWKDDVLIAVDQLRSVVSHPDTDDRAYIRLQVRDAARELFDVLGDPKALRAIRGLRGV